jgi:iron complex outermembrane receptor protein
MTYASNTKSQGATSLALRALALVGTSISALAFCAMPAHAQDAQSTSNPQAAEEDSQPEAIIVTGSILRRTNAETPSPVTTLSSVSLEQRGINNAGEALQRISANGAGTIAAGWNTGFNFAAGATAPALRGLTVQSTLSIFDGQRVAPYPLADDGQRNFVDLNTIPSAIIERVEVLRDGASSTYGADAIAGVINVITKKQVQGVFLNGSNGISQNGDAGERRFDVTVGYGDLDRQGFNFYVSGEYQKQDALFARGRGYPFNSADLTGVCGPTGSCMTNLNWNGITQELLDAGEAAASFNGLISIPGIALYRPVLTTGANAGLAGTGRYSYLNPGQGCGPFKSTNVPTDILDVVATVPSTICEVDFQKRYIMLQPEIERKGLSARFTANIGDNHQFYAMANYYRTDTYAQLTPLGFNGTPTQPTTASAYNLIAPVYVCSTGVGTRNGLNTGCDASNGTLNPYNPFAAAGETANLLVRSTRQRTDETSSRALRGAMGIQGSFGEGWGYNVDATASEVRLTRTQNNYIIPQRVMDVLARGTFNFADFNANSESTWDFIAPENITTSVSQLWQVQASITKEFFELPGGRLAVAAGAAYREESIDAPSANPPTQGNQYERYYSVNAVGTAGSRNVKSGFFEVSAPIVKQFELNVSGRYDKYSTGQDNFSPKVGVKFTPVPEIALRGTWTKGFRIPSFNEAFGLPTTGFVTRTVNCATYAAYCAAHNNNSYVNGQYSLGLTQTGNPALNPERSQSFTAGVVLEPIRNVSFTVDFWHIKVKDLIVGVTDTSAAEAAYYANNGVVNIPGITVVPGQPDPAFPNALPVLGFIQSSYKNATSQTVSGLDFGANINHRVTDGLRWVSNFEASYLLKYELTDENGDKLRYDGTLSPCNITSCSGSPKWRATWQNTLLFGNTSVSLTAYYTSGYDNASIDFGGVKGDCEGNAADHISVIPYVDGTPILCRAKPTWNADLTVQQKVGDHFTLYANVLNVFGIKPPFDPSAAYQLFQYNPAWAGPNMIGRYFRVGAKVNF